VRAAGFADLQDVHFAIFTYPAPDGVRLSELARRIRMTPQATNYLVRQLEALGYLKRRLKPGGGRRLIYLTRRSRRMVETMLASVRTLQAAWAE
jgi:DNA-binding MarR family transcriptional regulator